MAYTTINKSTDHFNTKLYTGNATDNTGITGVGFRPDWTWLKDRTNANHHRIYDSVRGATKAIYSSLTSAEGTVTTGLKSFDSDGFTLGTGSDENGNSANFVSWNWKAGGTAPSKTYKVVVVSDSGNKFRFRNSTDTATFGSSAVTLDLQEGGTYTFDGSDSTNSSHPFVLGTSSGVDGSYSTGVTYKLDGVTKTYSQYTSGYSSATSRQLIITVAASAPTLYYNCSVHSGMGGQINTNSTFGSSNFDGSIQTRVSENTTAGFNIVNYTGNNVNDETFGHGLGSTPHMIIIKNAGADVNWRIYHQDLSASNIIFFNSGEQSAPNAHGNGYVKTVSSTTYSTYTGNSDSLGVNGNGNSMIAYCFREIPGYSKFGTYQGNGDANGPFVYTGFKPRWLMWKRITDAGYDWDMYDAERDTYNVAFKELLANGNGAESSATVLAVDLLSNGFKLRTSNGNGNGSDKPYIYMAFGQTLVGSNNVPATAR